MHRPSFLSAKQAFAQVSYLDALFVGRFIGGRVQFNFDNKHWANACTIRFGHMHKSMRLL